ncbi:protein-disulfide reductase DsbD domain-containing protein [Carboxylicivirga taeanensis]|uniref:protein-disulfide reductase DsbD domain-containing protein n=1 Tax=Carboxylicivirga taeanensis TaxID=1416875 RepID=UPI003F6E1664
MMKKNIFALMMLLIFGAIGVSAQMQEPVKWKIEIKEINQFEVQVVAHATIEDGWKTYGLNVPEGGPVATEFTFEGMENAKELKSPVEVTKATVKHDEVFDMEVPFFKHEATITQNVRITKRPAKVKGYLTFMCCDNETCLPPTDVEFEFEVK